ncbi:MAG TPA: hypothetical protein VLW44_10040 [Streptosporangiaceae bacterium]|nr:hypothetical protein [Streptosporangiaceae bacterium]
MAVARAARATAALAREAWAVAVMAAVACVLAGCSAPGPRGGHAPPSFTPPPGSPPAWMLTRAALAQVMTSPAVRSGLARTRVYEILNPGQTPLAATGALPVVTFSSVTELEQAIAGNQLPAGTRAVLYDPEAWPFTPAGEQRDPVRATRQAMDIAHAHGLKLIVAPALNLTTVRPGPAGPRWRLFLGQGLAAALARVSDVIELQAQSLERETGTYAAFVGAAAAQARRANPRVTVLAGLSTNPPGAPVSSQQLTAAIRATSGFVSGYWLNIPGRGPRCPACNPPRPEIGRQALQETL